MERAEIREALAGYRAVPRESRRAMMGAAVRGHAFVDDRYREPTLRWARAYRVHGPRKVALLLAAAVAITVFDLGRQMPLWWFPGAALALYALTDLTGVLAAHRMLALPQR